MSVWLPSWVPHGSGEIAADYAERQENRPEATHWGSSLNGSLGIRLLELTRDTGRMVAELRVNGSPVSVPDCRGLELFVRHGSATVNRVCATSGTYVRIPLVTQDCTALELSADALVSVTMGHIASDDTETRFIDTRDDSAWLQGPADGIDVLPLHGHGTANVMLVRWSATAAFHPRLDPVGEEVFVLAGKLHDASNTFAAGSWVRNPVPAWQSWAGTPGTLIWYKNGHFPKHMAPQYPVAAAP